MKDLIQELEGNIKTFRFVKTNNTEYKVAVFTNNEVLECTFFIVLMPTKNTDDMPEYQLYPTTQQIPNWIKQTEMIKILDSYIQECTK